MGMQMLRMIALVGICCCALVAVSSEALAGRTVSKSVVVHVADAGTTNAVQTFSVQKLSCNCRETGVCTCVNCQCGNQVRRVVQSPVKMVQSVPPGYEIPLQTGSSIPVSGPEVPVFGSALPIQAVQTVQTVYESSNQASGSNGLNGSTGRVKHARKHRTKTATVTRTKHKCAFKSSRQIDRDVNQKVSQSAEVMRMEQVWKVLEKMQGEIAREVRVMLCEEALDQKLFTDEQKQRRVEAMKKCALESTSDVERHEAWMAMEAMKKCALESTSDVERHEAWMAMHRECGWVYGEKFDPVAKTHPNMLPWDELPASTRSKANIFDIVAKAGLEIEQLFGPANAC